MAVAGTLISAKKIALANKYITHSIQQDEDLSFTLKILKGTLAKNKLISSLNLEGSAFEDFFFTLDSSLKGKEVILKTEVLGEDIEADIVYEIDDIIDGLDDAVEMYPDYNVKYKVSRNTKGTKIKFSIVPKDKASTLNYIKGELDVSKDRMVYLSAKVSVDTKSSSVKDGQKALTNIFNSFVKQKEPKESDLDVLMDLYSEALEELDIE